MFSGGSKVLPVKASGLQFLFSPCSRRSERTTNTIDELIFSCYGESLSTYLTATILMWRPRPTTERHLATFNPGQESLPCGLIQDGVETRTSFNGKTRFLASSRKSWPKYEHDFEHMGLKAPISYGWDFSVMVEHYLHRNMWIHHGYFYSIGVGILPRQELSACAVLGYLRLDDSLCVTSSCFPHFPPMGPLLPEMIGRGREGYETWATPTTPFQFIFLF